LPLVLLSRKLGKPSKCIPQSGFLSRRVLRSLDTMELALNLERDGAFPGSNAFSAFSPDGLCSLFGVIPDDHHTASGDAFMTAAVFLRLLRLASRRGRSTLGRLMEPFQPPA